MKKLLSIILCISIILAPFASTMSVIGSNADDMQALYNRIENLPDPDDVTGTPSSALVSELQSIYDGIFTVLNKKDGVTPLPSNIGTLFILSRKCTVRQRCLFYSNASNTGKYLISVDALKSDPLTALYKEELKQVFKDVNDTPIEQRIPKRTEDYWPSIRNEVDGFFTVHDRLECLIPRTMEKVEEIAQAKEQGDNREIKWYTTDGVTNEVYHTWEMMSQELGEGDQSILTMDITVLKAVTKLFLSLTDRARVLPHLYTWYYLNKSDEDRMNEIKEEVVYLYDRIFNKVPLSPGETMPNLGLHPDSPTYSVHLIACAQYVLTPEERIAYLPTVAELDSLSELQRNMVINELNAIYMYLNSDDVPASEWPDLSKLQALTPVLQTLNSRMNRLPPPQKIAELNAQQLADVREEIFTLYDIIEGLGAGDTYPNSSACLSLRSAAAEALTLQERIDMLPSPEELENSTNGYNQFMYEEIIALRSLIDGLSPSDSHPDDTKLNAVEEYFSPSDVEWIYNETDLTRVINGMNASESPLNIVANIADSFETLNTLTLEKGTLTILGNGNELKVYPIELRNSAVLNLGKRVYGPENELTLLSNCNNQGSPIAGGCIINMFGTSRLNMCKGVVLGDSTARAHPGGIQCNSNSSFNMYGGTIRNCVNTSNATSGGVQVGDYAEFNMYDGLITDCYGYGGGAIRIAGYTSTFHMYGGTIQKCKTAGNGGGAIGCSTNSACKIIIDGGTITECAAENFTYTDSYGDTTSFSSSGFGGAIFAVATERVKLNGGTITKCRGTYGGAVCIHTSGGLDLNGTEIIENTATGYGGGIVLWTGIGMVMTDGKVSGNTSPGGGGIFAYGTNTFNMSGGEISENTVTKTNGGGGYYQNGVGYITMTGGKVCKNTVIVNNNLAGYGAGMRINGGGTFNMSGGEISENKSQYAAGVYINTATATISDDAKISENEASAYGAGVLVNSGTLNMTGGLIYKNLSTSYGGGVFLLNAGKVNVSGGEISYNSSNIGGGICPNKGTVTISGGEISYNGAQYGGGVAPLVATVNMTGGVIKNNEAFQGGGMYVFDTATANLNSGTITNNKAIEIEDVKGYGGGIFVEGTATIANGFKIYDNHAALKADDIAADAVETAVINLGTPCNEKMRGCHKVSGWYPDLENERWECYIEEGEIPISPISSPTTFTAQEVALKAAHTSARVASKNTNGRMLNEVTVDRTIDEISNNAAITLHRDFEQVNDEGYEWYIGADRNLPAGTKFTLMYYPDGDEASGVEYYYYELQQEDDIVAFADFTRMGESTKFVRTDTNDHIIFQLAVVFPDDNDLEEINVWLADTEYANEYPNPSRITVNFTGDAITKPTGNVTLSDVEGGVNSMSATATVTGIAGLERSIDDPENMLNAPLDDYRPVFTVELLDSFGKRVAFPDECTVKINGTEVDVSSGIAAVEFSGNTSFDIEADGLTNGKYELRTSVCMVSDEITTNPLGLIVNAATSSTVDVTAIIYAINPEIRGGELARVFKVPADDKTLTFDVAYIPTSADDDDITVTSYVKQANGSYVETSTPWSATVSGSGGNATATVTVPKDTPVGTYRFVFAIGYAKENYNIIVTQY